MTEYKCRKCKVAMFKTSVTISDRVITYNYICPECKKVKVLKFRDKYHEI